MKLYIDYIYFFWGGLIKVNNRELGTYGEKLATNFLRQHGYKILEKNFWCRYGEIDLIAKSNDYISFIEVKLGSQQSFVPLENKINNYKQKKMKQVAQYYLNFRNFKSDFRFDVVLITDDGTKPQINLIKNAFWIRERI